ncbi:hypothetical protein GIB67_011388 [Kingdonia uniflora]|uniref:Spatacsin C-terminal domain-containing protein n=1 Tax=Kingdonia uniflora TaxID=39325 RepID=A0A7J7M3P0_9MAGN|nr:hypothetical protein GIB67_011388 [Kingdonia uniflora]
MDSTVHDDTRTNLISRKVGFVGEAVGCSFQGCFYLVTQDGLYVVLPSVSVRSSVLAVESVGYWQPNMCTDGVYQIENLFRTNKWDGHWPPWKMEVLDRVLLYEGPVEADHMCSQNGWNLKISRMRRLQFALDFLKSDEIEQSLQMLVDVDLAEEGILRLLFTIVYRIYCKVGNDNEYAIGSRLLALAACFATKMVRKYGLLQHKKDVFIFQGFIDSRISPSNDELNQLRNSRRLREMAHFLEVIRNLQRRLRENDRRPGQALVNDMDALSPVDTNSTQDVSCLPVLNVDTVSSEIQNQGQLALTTAGYNFDEEKLALIPMESFHHSLMPDLGNVSEVSVLSFQDGNLGRKMLPLENPKDMIARWEINNLDLKTVVKDALQSDRLPLAVLQLHLQRLRDLGTDKEPHDTFKEVRDVGRAIAYDLFLKGETRLAISTLQRLGDDIEISLKQLLFGTVRRSLRMQIAEEMNRYDYLTPYEWKILERISLIERLYLSSSFWRTFHGRPKELSKSPSSLTLLEENMLHLNLTCSHSFKDCIIECGEIDGVVTGPWENIDNRPAFLVVDEDNSYTGYWVAAAVWADAWDQRTIDRIVLDQPFLMGVHVLWESQLEYHVCHNDWEEVSKLLEMIPTYLLSNESLQINLDSVGSHGGQYSEELDVVLMNIPNIKILHFPVGKLCSTWLQMLMEQELAKSFIFLKKRWEGTVEILQLLARAGLIVKTPMLDSFIESSPDPGFSNFSEESHRDTVEAMHKLVIHYCTEYDLPNLLDLYLDHHKLVLEDDSLASLQAAAGDCEWAKWLLLSRIKGHEYDASFWNSRSIISRNVVQGTNLSNLEVDEIIQTVDDMAEGGGEMAALATLVFAPSPIQKCLCSGGVNRQFSSSAQCTLENLRPALQHFPSLWRTLIGACFGQDSNGSPLGLNAKNIFGNSTLSDYLSWRESIFSASGRDTSLDQMLPCWFSKAIRRLVQLYVQGPLGWQSIGGISLGESFLHKDTDIFINAREHSEDSATSWEGTIQRNVEEELYASSVEENGFSVEHHLHRGHALAVLNHLLDLRTQKLKSGAILKKQSSGSSIHGQANIQVDVQTLLAPLTQSEESLLSSVIPLAIVHYEDSMLVASCAFLLELCGLSARMLQVDIAALRRISSFYRSSEYTEHVSHLSPKGSGDITSSLARALADHYMHHDERPSRALMAVLQHLENASLPLMIDGKTCGSWLLRGNGDETDIRFLQKAASEHWSLVTSFCQMHQIPLSTKYIAVLANDNDWVGFLTESQVGGYPFDVVVQEASKEFRDSRLKIHILTVLKSMHLARKKASSSSNSAPNGKTNEIDFSTKNDALVPVELFGLLAECERQKNPGETLLVRAKDLRWSLLAMIASCFPDVSPLSCLTVWLEITAARETSSITVNDIASQIATNVRAAVETTNSLSAHSRVLSFHYNRQNPKRRCLMEPTFSSPSTPSKASSTSGVVRFSLAQDITAEEKIKKTDEEVRVQSDRDEGLVSLTKMVGVLCEQRLFLPLLRAFEMFLPSCSLLPFIRALQAFSQMRLSEALAHLASFSGRIKDEPFHIKTYIGREGQIGAAWVSSTAVTAGDAILLTCPSAYEKRCLLQLLASTDFGDGGLASTRFRRFYWKINLAEPSLRKDDDLYLGNETLDDASLLTALEKKGHWEQARNWARQLESCGAPWRSALHHVTETQVFHLPLLRKEL